MQNLGKLEVAHMVAMVLHVVIPKEAIEEQGRGMSSIFKALDSKTQVLIEVPIADWYSAESGSKTSGFNSIGVSDKQVGGQDHSSIKRQAQMIHSNILSLSNIHNLHTILQSSKEKYFQK